MSGTDEPPLVVPIQPLEAEKAYELRYVQRNHLSFRGLPWLVGALALWMVFTQGASINALFWSPPERSSWRTVDGILTLQVGPSPSRYVLQNGATSITLSCAPGLIAAPGCNKRYGKLLDERLNHQVRAFIADHTGWFGAGHVLVRMEDERGRYIAYPQYDMRLRDLGFWFWWPIMLVMVVSVPSISYRQSVESRARVT